MNSELSFPRRLSPSLAHGGKTARLCAGLNPIETMWGNIKGKELAHRCVQDLAELDTAVQGGMSRVRKSRTLPFSFLKHAGLSL